jgi:small subunit ribosomal protein S2
MTTENQDTARPDVSSGDLPIGLRALIDAGVHFGHQTKRWNPKMRPFIYGARNGIHIIDLDQTARALPPRLRLRHRGRGRGGHVLFVGTKRQASDVVLEEAARSGNQFYVTGRWLGGTLTNFRTMKKGIDRLRELDRHDATTARSTCSPRRRPSAFVASASASRSTSAASSTWTGARRPCS